MATSTMYRGILIRKVHAGAVPSRSGQQAIHVFRSMIDGAPLASGSLAGMESQIDMVLGGRMAVGVYCDPDFF